MNAEPKRMIAIQILSASTPEDHLIVFAREDTPWSTEIVQVPLVPKIEI